MTRRILSRRNFLIAGSVIGGGALVTAVGGVGLLASVDVDGLDGYVDGERAVLNAFLVIHEDGRTVIYAPRTEMGQGIHTGLAMLVAEEADLPFDRITVEHPTEQLAVYTTLAPLQVRFEEASGPGFWAARRAMGLFPLVGTGGSQSTMGMWTPMRQAGAAARHMLVTAAAAQLDVPPGQLTTADGMVHHARSGRSVPYAELARAAATVRPPREIVLKTPSQWTLIGRSQPRVDLPAKVRGEPVFGVDVVLPDMLHASIRHAPVFGGAVARINNEAVVRRQPGVVDVAVIGGASVAVVADSWWRAETAAQLLEVTWAAAEADGVSSTTMDRDLRAALDAGDAREHLHDGDVEAALASDGGRRVEADYFTPFLAHACMEPMTATAIVRDDGTAEAWCSSQSPFSMRVSLGRGVSLADFSVRSITPHVTMNGGAFGRRSEPDVMVEAGYLAARHRNRPVKVMWSREEDIGRGVFRAMAAGRLRAVLGADGLPSAYDALVATPSLAQSTSSRILPIGNGASPHRDRYSIEGLDKHHYALPNRRISSRHVPSHVPVGFWRSNGYSFNTFFSESFIDECALAAGQDPLAYRRRLLRDSPRHLAVLDRVADMAGWGAPMGPGRGRGIAIEACYESVIAEVAEVTVSPDGEVTVDRVFCAIDVGTVVNPDAVIAQMEGGILFGVTTTLNSNITFERGTVMQTNFDDYPMQRLHNAPEVIVEIVPSTLLPGGAGEPGIVPVAGAIANAIHAATGRRLRSLPLTLTETVGVRRTRTVLPPAAASAAQAA